MSRIKITGGWYDSDVHLYMDEQGKFVPSLTQCLKLTGLSDYTGVDVDVLENAARRGTEVHELAATYNRYGAVDPTWITEECEPYFGAYMYFLLDSGFQPDPRWTETPMIATVHGFKVGVTPDCFGWRRREQWLLEFKCTAARLPSWSIQTAIQEAAIFKTNRCGRVRRFALMLMKDGKYRLGDEHTEHETDWADAMAMLRVVWRRLQQGQELWRRL